MKDLKEAIQNALAVFNPEKLRASAIDLLATLGYSSDRFPGLPDNSPDTFVATIEELSGKEFNQEKALVDQWEAADILFQMQDSDIRQAGSGQLELFDSSGIFDGKAMESYVFATIHLRNPQYTRTDLAQITRTVNRLFPMPVIILFVHGETVTMAIIERRLNKKDSNKDVLEKVTQIKDIRLRNPHRAHVEILNDLALPVLSEKHECRSFVQLHEAWRKTLDTNELNKKFYRELADWYFWALEHVDFPDDVEKDAATRKATSVIRLLTRLIFCWFLKEKGLIPENLFSERKLRKLLKSLDADDSSFYLAILQNLFFGTLNQRMNTGGKDYRRFAKDGSHLENRDEYGVKNLYRYQSLFAIAEEDALKLFEDIPFLNGGLFDCLDKENDKGKVLYVDGYTRNAKKRPTVPNFLFFSDYQTLDLSDAYGDKRRKKENVRGLIHLLESYKFTVTENTPIDEEIALDPELLGKVFENLLASYNPETGTTARKQTGSFYTPREIVNYMVDESLIAYLEGQLKKNVPRLADMDDLAELLREVFAYTEKQHPFDDREVDALINAIDASKILDPACGSGAFPMGILHKLVFILGKLDPGNERWKQKQLDKLDSAPMREELERTFRDNDDDFGRKLYLIENCIYGVDIQPIAIQISKLRFFISLLCDQRTNRNKAKNCGVRPLPNLETKFVAANTLIALDKGQENSGQGLLFDQRLPKLENELKAVRHKHFAAQRRRDKLDLQKKDCELRKQIANVLADGGMSSDAARQLAAWDPYDQNTSAPFFDPEWMYGIADGFDVVIGNPPYISAIDFIKTYGRELRADLTARYRVAAGAWDYFLLFFERGVSLLADEGKLVFITPNKYLSSPYAFNLRHFLLEETDLLEIADLSSLRVFEAAAVYPLITILCKSSSVKACNEETIHLLLPGDRTQAAQRFDPSDYLSCRVRMTDLSIAPELIWGFLLSPNFDILSTILSRSVSLETLGEVAATTTAGEADIYGALMEEGSDASTAWKVVNTGTIDPYISLWGSQPLTHQGKQFLQPVLGKDLPDISIRRREMYSSPKIIFAKMARRCEAFWDLAGQYAGMNTNCFWRPVQGVPIEAVTAVVLSTCFQAIYGLFYGALRMSGGYFQYQAPQLRVMPVPDLRGVDLSKISGLVRALGEEIDSGNEALPEELIAELDARVARLYNLTESEYETILTDTNTPDDFKKLALGWFERLEQQREE